MINNNPYNIPERPQKSRKIVIQPTPLYPHQANRTLDQIQPKNRNFIQKRSPNRPYFIESSFVESTRMPHTPHTSNQMNMSTVSQVSQWNGMHSNYQPSHFQELNEKIAAINSRLDNHDKTIAFLLEFKKQDSIKTSPLTESTILSHQTLSAASKQLERYHSTEEPWDRLRQQFSSYKSQSEKLSQNLRTQLQQQRDNITQELIVSFKDCLRQKFLQEQSKISEYLADFENSENEKITEKINQMTMTLKAQFRQIVRSTIGSSQTDTIFNFQLKDKLSALTLALNQLQANYKGFKDEVFDHVLATQDQKRWLYEMEDSILTIKNSMNENGRFVLPGSIAVSRQRCLRQALQLTYEQYIRVSDQPSIKANERTYLIDQQGYLLDSNRFYLVDSSNEKIKLSTSELDKLREGGFLK